MNEEVKPILRALTKGDLSTLTADQMRQLDILTICDETIRLYGVSRESANMISSRIQLACDHKYHINMVYRWIGLAQQVFGAKEYINKDYWRQVLLERLWKMATNIEHELLQLVEVKDKDGNALKNEDGSPMMQPKPMDPKTSSTLIKVYAQIADILQLDTPDDGIKPDEDYDTIVITPNPVDIGFKEITQLPEKALKRLLELGAKQDEDGRWQ